MSQARDEMAALRKKIMMGEPPYEIDPFLQTKIRKSGTRGLEELRDIGNYSAGAEAAILALEASLQIVDHLLERMR